jgi:DNA/RNA endonuclease YhcR with UshA esterase domain
MRFIRVRCFLKAACLFATVFTTSHALASDCVPFAEAHHYLGKTKCVTGTVVQVKEGNNGVTFLDFCEHYETCPFTVVVFQGDLRRVGDVYQLAGRTIEIRGTVDEYDGRAEIILRHSQQLGDSASLVPALPKDEILAPSLPKDYDVERRGHYSAGKFKHPKRAKVAAKKKQGAPGSIEDPSQP